MKSILFITVMLSVSFCFAQQRTAKGEVLVTTVGSFGGVNNASSERSGRDATQMEYKQTTTKTKDGGTATLIKFITETEPENLKAENKKIVSEALAFSVYPNPARSEINIKVTGNAASDKYIVRIKNLVGQNIFEQPFNDKQLKIDVSAFPRGFFLVNVCDEKGTKCHTQKLMIE